MNPTSIRRLSLSILCLCAIHSRAAAQGSLVPYGAGAPGQGGFVPRIWSQGNPYLGTQPQISLERSTPGALAVLLVAGGPAAYAGPGFTLLVDPLRPPFFLAGTALVTGTQPGDGGANLALPVPADPLLEGARLFAQWVVVDAGAAAGLAASDGLAITLTRGPMVLGAGIGDIETVVPPATVTVTQPAGFEPWAAAFTRDGAMALTLHGLVPQTTGFLVWDARTQPMTQLASGPGGAGGLAMAVHPDQERAYVVYRVTNGSGAIGWYDIRPGSPTLGARLGNVTGITAPGEISQVAYADISADGRVLVVLLYGLFANIRSVLVVDVDPASPTRDQVLRQHRTSLQQFSILAGVAAGADGQAAYLATADNSQGRIARMDLTTGAITRLTARFAGVPYGVVRDPRGRFLATAATSGTVDSIAVISLEPANLFAVRTFLTPGVILSPLALSPDATLAVCASLNVGFVAFDLAAGLPVWNATSPSGLAQWTAVR